MDPLYRPQGVEQRWQQTWEEEGLYAADAASGKRLWSGSAAERHRRAPHGARAERLHPGRPDPLASDAGFNALWQPGYDHAGIATWAVMERSSAAGDDRRTRARRLRRAVQEWLDEYGGVIMGQFRRLGSSLDYRRERFTMDDAY